VGWEVLPLCEKTVVVESSFSLREGKLREKTLMQTIDWNIRKKCTFAILLFFGD
jgi:hypothetical protein